MTNIKNTNFTTLNEYIEDQKDLKDGLIALTKYNANPKYVISLEEIMKKYNLED